MINQPPQFPRYEMKPKGLPALAWMGIGCVGIIFIVIVCAMLAGFWGYHKIKTYANMPGKTGAELVIRMNQDLEKVSENDTIGEMTLRVKSTGKLITLKYDDLAQGHFPQFVKGDLAKVPSWVPHYPAAADEAAAMQSENANQVSGVLTFTSSDSAEAIKKFYEEEASKRGFSHWCRSGSFNISGTENLSLECSGGKHAVSISVAGKSGGLLNVLVGYTEKK